VAGVSLYNEASAYAALESLQGQAIPKFFGFYEIWGILKLLALEPVGYAIPEGEIIGQGLRTKMRTALRCIHDAGFVHGDIARRNFCRTESGNVFLVDLERCQRVENQSELEDEMNQVDEL
jgi:tRNA A-37 threonylcarbamoyl transferase component Bud32